MNARPPTSFPRRLWALGALVVLLALPAPAAVGLLAVALAARIALGAVRAGAAIRRARLSPPADAVVLGTEPNGARAELRDEQLAAHGLILGASGAGKSTTLLAVLCDQIRRGRPVVAVDLKGSPAFARQLGAAAAAAGRPLRVWSPDGPSHWNPLQHGNATELKDKLIAAERFTEPHYQRAAERYVQMALQTLMAARPQQPPSLAEVVDVLDPRRLAALGRELDPERAARLEAYLGGLTRDQHSAIRGLGTRLAILTESHAGALLEPDPACSGGIDLRRALAGDEVVLFSLNSSVYGKLSAQLGTLAVQDLVAASGHRLREQGTGPPRPPAVVGIDEFSALGADNVISLLARGRESGISVLLATQELADLDRAARGLRDQVLGNTAVKIIHRQDVPASAHAVAQMVGSEMVWEDTLHFGGAALGPLGATRGSRRQVERFLVHPDEVKRLRTGEAIAITKVPEARTRRLRVRPPAGPSFPPPAAGPSSPPPAARSANLRRGPELS